MAEEIKEVKIVFDRRRFLKVVGKLTLAASFFVPLIFYLITLAPGITMGDSGELITAAATLGVPHPPGFPAWTFLTHWFTKIPISNVAWRVNFSTAVYSSLACAMLFLVAKKVLSFLKEKGGKGEVGGVGLFETIVSAALAITYGFTKDFWNNSVTAEVYTAAVLVLLAAFYFLLLWQERGKKKYFMLSGFFCGLGLGTHYIVALFYPALAIFFLLAWLPEKPRWSKGRLKSLASLVGLGVLGFLLGLLIFLYLPLAARSNPAINWGNPSNWGSFKAHVMRQQYAIGDAKIGEFHLPVSAVAAGGGLERLKVAVFSFGKIFWWELGLLNLLAATGLGLLLFKSFKNKRLVPLAGFFISTILLNFAFICVTMATLPFASEDYSAYLSGFALTLILVVVGIVGVKDRFPKALVLGICITFPLYFLLRNISLCNWSENRVAQYFIKDVLDSMPSDSTLITSGDLAFPFIYALSVEGQRPDIDLKDSSGNIFPFSYDLPQGSGLNEIASYSEAFVKENKKVIDEAKGNVYILRQSECELNLTEQGLLVVAKNVSPAPAVDFDKNFQEILALKPQDLKNDMYAQLVASSYHLRRGFWLFETKSDLEGAKEEFAVAADFNRESFALLNSVAACYMSVGEKAKAVEVLEKASSLRPNNAGVLYNLGLFYMQSDDLNKAAENFEKSLAINPLFLQRSGSNLGLIYARQKRWEEAIAVLDKVYALGGSDSEPSVLYGLGLSHLRLDQFAEAVPFLQKAVAADPSKVSFWEALAVSLFNSKDQKAARVAALKVQELDPENKYAEQIIEKTDRIE